MWHTSSTASDLKMICYLSVLYVITLHTLGTIPASIAIDEVVSTLHRKYRILRVILIYSY